LKEKREGEGYSKKLSLGKERGTSYSIPIHPLIDLNGEEGKKCKLSTRTKSSNGKRGRIFVP